MNPADS